MKTIGLIGGITWLSTLDYYRLLNEKINERLGGVEAGKIILYSVNFAEIKLLTEEGRWDEMVKIMTHVAKKLELADADCILIGANTMHKIADEIQQCITIPLIHIAEVTAKEIKKQRLQTVALLGTKYTMQLDFYKNKLAAQGIAVIIPDEDEIEMINTAIYTEMGKGVFLPATKQKFVTIINKLTVHGAEGIILGCTEIPILIKQEDCRVPVFDTTRIHADAAVEFALDEQAILAGNNI
jgi:aspartate racemase